MQESQEKLRRSRKPSIEIETPVDAGLEAPQSLGEGESAIGVAAIDEGTGRAGGIASADALSDRKRIEEQLAALERKQAELRRALAIADHPALSEAIRLVAARAYAVERATAKLSQGLSKAEERRKETLEKKLFAAQSKRVDIDAQIAEIETELAPLGEARQQAFRDVRHGALESLTAVLAENEPIFRAAGFEIVALVPEILPWVEEVRAIAEKVISREEL